MELTIEQIEGKLKTYGSEMKEQVQGLINEKTEGSEKKLLALETNITEVNETLKNLDEQLKKQKASTVVGLKEELKNKPWSWTSFVGALYKEAYKDAPDRAEPWREAGYEKEIIDAYSKKKAQIAGDGSSGGYLVPPEVTDEIIGLVSAAMPIMNMGPTIIKGLVGDLPVPKLTQRHTGYWVGENQKPTESSAAFGEIILRPKKVGAFTKQSNRLIYQSRGVSDMIIKEEIKRAMALTMHQGLLNGSGSERQPKGIMNYSDDFTANSVSIATNGERMKIDNALGMVQAIDTANELRDDGNYGYLMHPAAKWGMKRERITQFSDQAQADGQPIMMNNLFLTDKVLEDQMGFPFKTTTQIPADETKGTSSTTSQVLFGDWKMFWIAMWRDLIFKVSDVAGDGSTGSAFLDDQMYIVVFQEVDSALMRGSAFTRLQGIETTESNW